MCTFISWNQSPFCYQSLNNVYFYYLPSGCSNYTCSDGSCGVRCNGTEECSDGGDEIDCTTPAPSTTPQSATPSTSPSITTMQSTTGNLYI